CLAIGARALRSDVHDVRAIGDESARFRERRVDVRYTVAGKGIRNEIHDAHDQRWPWKLEHEPPRDQLHASATAERSRRAKRSVCVKPTSFASAIASSNPAPTSPGV